MNYLYPIFLNLEEQPCLVIGGGEIAFRKVKSLIRAKAKITLISPKLNQQLQKLVKRGSIHYKARSFRHDDLNHIFLVIAATSDRSTNQRISQQAKTLNILVNVVDDPDLCNFHVPSTFQQGDLKIAISTNGKVPVLGKLIKEKIAEIFVPELRHDIENLAELREQNKRLFPHDLINRKKRGIKQARRVLNSYFN